MINKGLISLMGMIIVLGLVLGCSSAGRDPVTPSSGDGADLSLEAATTSPLRDNRQLWGLWNISIDIASGSCNIKPLRTANFTANVNKLLEGQPGNLLIEDMDVTDFFTEGRLDCTITLKHPFPGLDMYNGFDVWGVFMHNSNGTLGYDSLTYGADPNTAENVAVLLNPDGWTRWFNYTEFNGGSVPILEYHPGALSNLSNPSATLNPFIIFADSLGFEDDYHTWITTSGNADDRGIFKAGGVNSRRYELEFPIIDSSPVVDFQYAVIATWVEGDPALTGNPDIYEPDDFPTSANVEEAFFLNVSTIGSDLYYVDETTFGGNFIADIEVFDWQGGSVGELGVPNEMERMIIEGDFLPGGSYELSQAELGAIAMPATENSSVFQVDITSCTPLAAGEAELWLIVESAGLNGDSYDQGFPTEYPDPAKRAAFLLSSVSVSGDTPATILLTAPNGGEEWMVGSHEDITWTTTDYTGQIKLEYSKDEFVSDINEIVAATDDDGIFDWEIPDDPSDTVRVRATLVAFSSISDDSDENFSIAAGGWTDPVLLDTNSHMPRSIENAASEMVSIWHKNGQGVRYGVNDGTGWTTPEQAYNTNPSFMHILADQSGQTVYASYKGSGSGGYERHALRWTGSTGAWDYMWLYGWTGQPSILLPDDDGSFAHIYTYSGGFQVIGFNSWGSGWSGMGGWYDSYDVRMSSCNFHERDNTYHLISYHRNRSSLDSARFVRAPKSTIYGWTSHMIYQGATGELVDSVALSVDSTGTLHTAWRVVNGANYRMDYAYSTDNGNTWSTPETLVNTTSEILLNYIGIDIDSSEVIHITYAVDDAIYLIRSNATGWDAPVTYIDVGSIPSGYHYTEPFPLITSDDILHIFYIYKGTSSSHGDLYEITYF